MNKNKEIKQDEILDDKNDLVGDEMLDKDDYIAKLNDDLNEQKKKTDEYFEHLKRNMAEFDNFKKRMNKEKDSMYYTITADLVSNLLPIIDNFEKALRAECKDDSYKNGMEMIYSELTGLLDKLGIEEIDALGKTFDPNFHEAVMHEEDESKGEKEVVEVFRKGYMINDRVIRHSMVKVAN